jgi:hypothetical protein
MRHLHKAGITALLACVLVPLAGCERGYHLLYGLIDEQGQWTAEPRFDALEPPAAGLAAARQGDLWGFVGPSGEWTVEPRYSAVRSFSEGRAAVRQDERWRFIDRSGEVVIPGPFTDAQSFDGGMAAVQTEAGWGFVDSTGRFVIEPRFEELGAWPEGLSERALVRCFSEGLCAVKTAAGWGYIDRAGRQVIEPAFGGADWFREGRARVRVSSDTGDGAVGFIDRRGRWAIAPRFREALWFSGGRAIAVPQGSAEPAPPAVMIDAEGREIAVVGWEPFHELGDEVAEFLRATAPDYLGEGRVPATRAGLWGFMNRQGDWVIEPRFGLAMPFRNGVAAVARDKGQKLEDLFDDNEWGLMDNSGRWIREPAPFLPGRYGDPWLMAAQHGLQGLLDRDGRWHVSPRFASVDDWLQLPGMHSGYQEGQLVAAIFADHRWIIVDRHGRTRDTANFEWLDALGPPSGPEVLTVLNNGRWGLTDQRLRVLLPAQLDTRPQRSGGLIKAVHEGRTGCLDLRGRWVIPAEFADIQECQSGAIAAASDTGWGIWRAAGGWLLPPQHKAVWPLWTDTWEVETASGWQIYRLAPGAASAILINGEPYEAIDNATPQLSMARRGDRLAPITEAHPVPAEFPFEQFDARYMDAPDGRAQWLTAVRADGHWGLLDAAGRPRLPVRFDEIGSAWNGLVAVAIDGAWGIVDLDGRELFAAGFAGAVPVSRKVVAFREGDLWGLADRSGKVLSAPKFEGITHKGKWLLVTLPAERGSAGGLPAARSGLIDVRGHMVAEPRFHSIEEFSGDHWLARDDEGWVLLDKNSGLSVRRLPGVQKVGHIAEERAVAELQPATAGGPSFGYLDARGGVAIPPQYDQAWDFHDGIAVVERAGKCGVIDRDGRIVLAVRYDHCNHLAEGRVAAGVEAPFDRERWPGR